MDIILVKVMVISSISYLPVASLRHDGKSVLRVLLHLDIADIGGGIVLTLPARWCKVTISVEFRVV